MPKSLLHTIEAVVDYIEANIKAPITLESIAAHIHVSKFHLHRIMRTATGMPLAEYVRARKLSHSVRMLLNPELRVIDICAEYHFQYEQTYIRAFKKQFGVTPAAFRSQTEGLRIIEKYDVSRLANVAGGIVFEPYFIVKPSFTVVGLTYLIHAETNLTAKTATHVGNYYFYEHRPLIPNRTHDTVYIGLTELVADPEYSEYTPSSEVHSTEGVPAGYSIKQLPANTYIVFKYIGDFHANQLSFSHLKQLWEHIDRWLPTSAYYHSAPYFYEHIDLSVSREDYCEVELFIPVGSPRRPGDGGVLRPLIRAKQEGKR